MCVCYKSLKMLIHMYWVVSKKINLVNLSEFHFPSSIFISRMIFLSRTTLKMERRGALSLSLCLPPSLTFHPLLPQARYLCFSPEFQGLFFCLCDLSPETNAAQLDHLFYLCNFLNKLPLII